MVDREGQITLVISEKLNEGILEACIHYGVEKEIGSFVIPLLFSGSVSSPFSFIEKVFLFDK